MKIVRAFQGLALAAVVLATGCSAPYKDITTDSETNPKVNFQGYCTYAWSGQTAVLVDPNHKWTAPDLDVGAELTHIVNRELRARNMTEVVDMPDVHVMMAVGVDMESLDVVVDKDTKIEHWEEVPKGAVMVILADPETHRVMWYGTAEGNIDQSRSVSEGRARLDHAIRKMFKKLPL